MSPLALFPPTGTDLQRRSRRPHHYFAWLLGWAVIVVVALWAAASAGRAGRVDYDILVRGGTVFDGTGAPGRRADVGVRDGRVIAVGRLDRASAATVLDATGLAVAPGFINMLSWSTESLLLDGRAQSTIRQGITTEIMGEGTSMGPLSPEMKQRMADAQGDPREGGHFDITWTTLGEYLRELERLGISTNVASFIGATTIREHVIGLVDRPPTPEELTRMRELVRQEMEDGALGIGSSLIYAPGTYASTEELIALCRVAAAYRGKYISHVRSEGRRLVEAVDELLRISREAGLPAEIYHLKAAGSENWSKMAVVLERIEAARRSGLSVTANMYLYPAGATGLHAAIPPSALDGGFDALLARLANARTRAAIAAAIRTRSDAWENLYQAVGSPERVLLVGFRSEVLRPFIGRTLGAVADARGRDPVDTLLDLIAEERGDPSAVYFMMSEENIRSQLRRPWVAIGSDAASMAPEGVFLRTSTHPRTYGNVARLLGKYVRDERVITLPDAIRRLSGLPASTLGLEGRGVLRSGAFADLVAFDPGTIADRATFARPHQYSVGMRHVLVNGVPVLRDGAHTGARPGRALYGPGRRTIDAPGGRRSTPAVEPWPRQRIVSIAGPPDAEPGALPVP